MHEAFEDVASRGGRRTSLAAAKHGLAGRAVAADTAPRLPRYSRMVGWLLLAALAGCSGMPLQGDPANWVGKRAQDRWDALIEKDLDKAYQFLSPGSQETMSLAAYKARIRPGMWRKAEVKEVKCEGRACKVTMAITYDHKVMKSVQTDVRESWLIENGNAWFVFEG